MPALRRIAWFVVLALVLLGFSLLVGHWFLQAEASEPNVETTIRRWARHYNVDEEFLVCIARAESALNPNAVGDEGLALGLFQWHAPSWILMREAMGLSAWTWLRLDANESAKTTAYAIGVMKLDRWWATTGGCR